MYICKKKKKKRIIFSPVRKSNNNEISCVLIYIRAYTTFRLIAIRFNQLCDISSEQLYAKGEEELKKKIIHQNELKRIDDDDDYIRK